MPGPGPALPITTVATSGGQPRRPQTGQAPMPCECSTFSATRICSSRLAPDGEPDAAVGTPGARRELQAAGEAVTGADAPVTTRLALRDGVPVHAVRPDRRRRRDVRRQEAAGRTLGSKPAGAGGGASGAGGGGGTFGAEAGGASGAAGRVREPGAAGARPAPGGRQLGSKPTPRWRWRTERVTSDACDRGEDERLTDVLQCRSFRGARAPKQTHGWV